MMQAAEAGTGPNHQPGADAVGHADIEIADLVPGAGVAALVDGVQVAIFYLPDENPAVYAIGNWDPIGEANVLARGIVGDIDGELVVASPLYKQHFSLIDGRCLDNADVRVPVYEATLQDDTVRVTIHQ